MTHRVHSWLHPLLWGLLTIVSTYFAVLPSARAAVRVLEVISSEQAQEHIGETVTVCGPVASARFLDRDREKPTFLNFDQPYPDQTFTARILGSSRAGFNEPPEVLFNGKTICVTGRITGYRGRPEIVVEDPSQIVIEEAGPVPMAEARTNTSQPTPTTPTEVITNTSQKPPIPSVPKPALPGIPSAQAQQYMGQSVTVCGLVASGDYAESHKGGRSFLNFDQPYPNQTLTVVIPGPNRAKFRSPPEALFKGKTVCVTGAIVNYRGKPEIVIENPSQIVIQEATPSSVSGAVTEAITNAIQITPVTAVEPVTNTIQKIPALPPPRATLQGVPSAQAKQHIGEITIVCGVVVSAKYLGSQGPGRTFLNFDQPYPNQTFSVIIEGPNRAKFASAPEALFQGKTVCVAGRIVDNRGKPQIVVENPSQILIQR